MWYYASFIVPNDKDFCPDGQFFECENDEKAIAFAKELANFGADYGEKHTNMKKYCKEHQIAAECWAQEYGMGFQQHFAIDNTGKVVVELETMDCEFDDDDEPIDGFYNYGEHLSDSLMLPNG